MLLTNIISIRYEGKKRKKNKEAANTTPHKKQQRNRIIQKALVISFTELKGMVWFVFRLA